MRSDFRNVRHCEATCAKAVLSESGSWITSPDQHLRENGEEILNRGLLEGCHLVNMIDPESHEHCDDVDQCIQAFQDRETTRAADSAPVSTLSSTRASTSTKRKRD